MTTPTIDQLDSRRYSLFLYITVCWTIWFGIFVFNELITDRSFVMDLIQGIIGSVSFFFLVLVFINYWRLSSKIRNSRLNEAVNNELYEVNKFKSLARGFWSLLICLALFLGLSYFFTISAKLVCIVTIYAGVLSTLISALIYNREGHDDGIDQ
ncbi:MAG TPA: hypothetical protein VK179_07795 [Bacteroidales bacterium]|nr:hypothetical protein [Bacteroidales bacterium]